MWWLAINKLHSRTMEQYKVIDQRQTDATNKNTTTVPRDYDKKRYADHQWALTTTHYPLRDPPPKQTCDLEHYRQLYHLSLMMGFYLMWKLIKMFSTHLLVWIYEKPSMLSDTSHRDKLFLQIDPYNCKSKWHNPANRSEVDRIFQTNIWMIC